MWSGWPLERVLYLLPGILFAGVFVQVTLYHMRQNFRHPSMWLPVLATPVVGATCLLLAGWNAPVLKTLLAWTAGVTAVASVYGTYLHGVGVGNRVGGFNVNNAMVGPPIMLPVLLGALSVLAWLVVYIA